MLKGLGKGIVTAVSIPCLLIFFGLLEHPWISILAGLVTVVGTVVHFSHPADPQVARVAAVLFWLFATGASCAVIPVVLFQMGQFNPNMLAPASDSGKGVARGLVILACLVLVVTVSYLCRPIF